MGYFISQSKSPQHLAYNYFTWGIILTNKTHNLYTKILVMKDQQTHATNNHSSYQYCPSKYNKESNFGGKTLIPSFAANIYSYPINCSVKTMQTKLDAACNKDMLNSTSFSQSRPLIYHVCYLPFFYTLEKQILTRRNKSTFFRQQQLWKLIGYLCKAVLQWQQYYPTEKLGILCPSNLVINSQGQIKVVNKLTFFAHNYASLNPYYTPPESRNNSLIKYALNPYSDPVAVEASLVYGIGAVVLQATTLTLADWEPAGLEEKLVMLRQLGYTPALKETILSLLQENQMARYKTNQLLQLSKKYRNRYM